MLPVSRARRGESGPGIRVLDVYESLLRVNQPTASEAISGKIVCPPSNSL
jgi:hypothetical protein